MARFQQGDMEYGVNARRRRELELIHKCFEPTQNPKGAIKLLRKLLQNAITNGGLVVGMELQVNPLAFCKCFVSALKVGLLGHSVPCSNEVSFQ